MGTIFEDYADLKNKNEVLKYLLEHSIDGYNKYLDAVIDNGYWHNYCGPMGESSLSCGRCQGSCRTFVDYSGCFEGRV